MKITTNEKAIAEAFFPKKERDRFSELVEDAVDSFCNEFRTDPRDDAKLTSVYTSMLVHAAWALADMGIGREDLAEICANIVNDASNAAEVDEWTTSPGGQA